MTTWPEMIVIALNVLVSHPHLIIIHIGSCVGIEVEAGVVEKSIVTLTQLIISTSNYTNQIVYGHSQIIPSATRTKVDKIRTIRKVRERRMRSDDPHEESFDDDELEYEGKLNLHHYPLIFPM